MSVVPLLLNLASDMEGVLGANDWNHMLDDDFGFGIYPMDISRPRINRISMIPRRRYSPYNLIARRNSTGRKGADGTMSLTPTIGKDGFQVCMDVSQFKPNELTVKTVDKTIIVEGKHEEREDDHGLIQRHFVRKYTLPKDYDSKDVVSTISSDGVLTVKAPPPPIANKKQKERIVQIQQTGPAHLSIKSNEQTEENGANADKMETGK